MTSYDLYRNAFIEAFELSADYDCSKLEYMGIEEWDSVGHMSLIALLEDAFGIMMDTDDIIDFNSFEKGMSILEANYSVGF